MLTAVAIPTFGRDELLWRCLASVARLDPAPDVAFVVDGNAEPVPLPPSLPSWIEVVRESNRGPAHARNTAIDACRRAGADLVCFLDDDAVAPPSWVDGHVRAHLDHPEAGGVGGSITNLSVDAIAAEHLHRTVFAPLRGDAGPVRMVPSVNVSYKLRCLDAVGGFDERLDAGEDVEHCERLRAAGWTIWFEPGLAVGHHYPTSMRALVRKQQWYGRGFARTRSMHPSLPGADLLTMPWWRAVTGTVPHLTREGVQAARTLGWTHAPVAVACQAAHRGAALRERRRLEHERSDR